MSKHASRTIGVIAAAIFAALAPSAHPEMYKWVNDDGTTTYSNEPPADPSSVQEFTVVDIAPMDASRPIVITPTPQRSEPEPEIATSRPSVRAQLPQAVQDPCLTSSDRLCYLKHKDHYKPYVGYSPRESSVAEAGSVFPPRGATSGAVGSGSVSGGTRPK